MQTCDAPKTATEVRQGNRRMMSMHVLVISLTAVVRQVASFLQNTPAITRQSYVAPCLFRLFEGGKLVPLWEQGGVGKNGLRQREIRLGALLEAVG